MFNRRLSLGISAVGIAIAVAFVPAGTSWASSHKTHQKSHHKAKAKTTGVASCPSASVVGTPAGTTYTGPTTEQAAEKGWIVCDYSAQGQISLTVSLYTIDDSLRSISSNAAATPKKVSGIGNAASHYGTIVFVQRDSAPSFSVIDDSGNLTLSQTEAIAKTIVAG
ncbi:MAG TPA: hypothetical protein VGG38_18090 [Acidimicrobiales bacterium]|jgi:hypothetical protein